MSYNRFFDLFLSKIFYRLFKFIFLISFSRIFPSLFILFFTMFTIDFLIYFDLFFSYKLVSTFYFGIFFPVNSRKIPEIPGNSRKNLNKIFNRFFLKLHLIFYFWFFKFSWIFHFFKIFQFFLHFLKKWIFHENFNFIRLKFFIVFFTIIIINIFFMEIENMQSIGFLINLYVFLLMVYW